MRNILLLIISLIFFSCNDVVLPKPKAYLSLEYVLKSATIVEDKNNWLKITYPKLKASIDITYRPIENNLKELLTEAEKMVFKHTVKAEQIIPKDFINSKKRVFGSLYEITGNAASQIQFHITDSTNNFIKGSLYFYAKPNYDSILPAVAYIKEDVLYLIESLEWKK